MIVLYKPKIEELWFREKLMNDPDTMAYNHAWGGTISFPKEKWEEWYDKWLINDNKRFYRYLLDEETKNFIGEVAYHYDEAKKKFIINLIIYASYRNQGYGTDGLNLLCKSAKENGINILYDDIAIDNPSVKLFIKNGFTIDYQTNDTIMVKKTL